MEDVDGLGMGLSLARELSLAIRLNDDMGM